VFSVVFVVAWRALHSESLDIDDPRVQAHSQAAGVTLARPARAVSEVTCDSVSSTLALDDEHTLEVVLPGDALYVHSSAVCWCCVAGSSVSVALMLVVVLLLLLLLCPDHHGNLLQAPITNCNT